MLRADSPGNPPPSPEAQGPRGAPLPRAPLRLKVYWGGLLMAWTMVAAASLAWNLYGQRQEAMSLALTTARLSFEKDLLYRRWASQYGGVYVPTGPETPPNPYLSHLPERDLTTPSGRRLTLINPAYMTRQVYVLAAQGLDNRAHLTSRWPLSPDNAPDPWEVKVLQAFEQGEKEIYGVETLDGRPYLRLMRPFFTEKSCLACHAHQGYQEGQVRGGISVSIALAPFRAASRRAGVSLWVGHALLGALGVLVIVLCAAANLRLQERLRQQALRDSLTGLYNHSFMIENLYREILRVKRQGAPLSVIMMDLDHFKDFNDTHGHPAGDALLMEVARILENRCRKEDLACRYGGEEFFLILPETPLEVAFRRAEELRQAVMGLRLKYRGQILTATISIGVAAFPINGSSHAALLQAADEALYRAKEGGRNRVETALVAGEDQLLT